MIRGLLPYLPVVLYILIWDVPLMGTLAVSPTGILDAHESYVKSLHQTL